MNKRVVAATFGVAAAALLLTGCGDKWSEPFQDAPRKGVNNGPATIITMPDGFNNVSFKCNGRTGVYVIYHGDAKYGAVSAVASDPNCP